MSQPWWGVDLDGTLAYYDEWRGPTHIGAPIPKMVERVKKMLTDGQQVRIFTARVFPLFNIQPDEDLDLLIGTNNTGDNQAVQSAIAIQKWCQEHLGRVLPVTCAKDYGMTRLFDDRAVQVIVNTGMTVHEALGLEYTQ